MTNNEPHITVDKALANRIELHWAFKKAIHEFYTSRPWVQPLDQSQQHNMAEHMIEAMRQSHFAVGRPNKDGSITMYGGLAL